MMADEEFCAEPLGDPTIVPDIRLLFKNKEN
jgi:hypothetical protein